MKLKNLWQKLINNLLSRFSYCLGKGWSRPKYVGLILTQRCNFRCLHCQTQERATERELSYSEWKKVIDQIANFSPGAVVDLTGGEPLLHKDVFKIIQYLKRKDLFVTMHTNGFFIDKDRARKLIQLGLDEIVVSFYSLNPKTQDFLRGKRGVHQKMLSAINYLRKSREKSKSKTKIKIAVLLTRYNIEEFPKMIEWAKEKQIEVIPQPLMESLYSGEHNPDWFLKSKSWPKPKQVLSLSSQTSFLKVIKDYYLNPKSVLKYKCYTAQNNLIIDSGGKVSFCYDSKSIGDVKSSFVKIWNSQKANRMRQKIKECSKYCRIVGCNFEPSFFDKIKILFSREKKQDLDILFQKRLRKALWISWLLQLVPFIRLIGLNGSMTKGKIRKESDIDFLIIAKQGRIWIVRFLTIILTRLIGQKAHGEKIAGRICLNRYQVDNFLEIQPHNFYHANCFSSLVPLFDINLYPKYQKKNRWMEKFNFKIRPTLRVKLVNNFFFRYLRKINELFLSGNLGNWLERKLGNFQKERIRKDKRTQEAPKGRVRFSEKEICIHFLRE